jgi:hypothetical protein
MRNSMFQIRRPTNGVVRLSRRFLVFVLVALLSHGSARKLAHTTAGDNGLTLSKGRTIGV